jgi:hypothetical protein
MCELDAQGGYGRTETEDGRVVYFQDAEGCGRKLRQLRIGCAPHLD